MLPAFLRCAAGRRFEYGRFDCFLFVADWCTEIFGIDPGTSIRGRYGNLDEGLALVGVRNLPMAFHSLLGAAGLRLTRAPLPGDVVTVALSDGLARGGILTSRGYVVVGEEMGLSRVEVMAARRVAAWSVNA